MSYFPSNYCAFECVIVLRMIFFLAFNLINTYALCFTVNENKVKIKTASKTKVV